MGTEIQAKSYFLGSHSRKDLNDSASGGMLLLYPDHKTLMNGQHYDSFLARPAMDAYMEYGKEQLKKTILQHESIFRQQLEELHRLYRTQRDLMNEIRRRHLQKHLLPAETAQKNPLSSHIPSEDVKRKSHVSDFPFMDLNFGRCSMPGTSNIQSSHFPSSDRVTAKDLDFLDAKGAMAHGKVLNLELPADLEVKMHGERTHPIRDLVAHERDMRSSLGGVSSSGCNSRTSSELHTRITCDSFDLNQPLQVEGLSTSASLKNLDNFTCLEVEAHRPNVYVNAKSSFGISPKQSSESSFLGSREIFLKGMRSKNEGNHIEQSTVNETGQTRCSTNSLQEVVCPGNATRLFKSLLAEPGKADKPPVILSSDEGKTKHWQKKIIFGVEISEENCARPSKASWVPCLKQPFPQSDPMNSESSSLSPKSKLPMSSLDPHLPSLQGNAFVGNSNPSNRVPSLLILTLDSVGVENGNISMPEELVSSCSRKHFEGSDCMDAKFGKDKEVKSVKEKSRLENLGTGLPWLKSNEYSTIEPIEERNGSYHTDFANKTEKLTDQSQNSVKERTSPSALDNELKRTEVDISPSNGKILGFPIFGMPQAPKDINLNADNGGGECHDHKHRHQLEIEDLVTGKGINNLVSGLRHHIDLNLGVNEEEEVPVPSFPSVVLKIATTEIDLEAPAVLECEADPSWKSGCLENQPKGPSKLPPVETKEHIEEFNRVAAEAIVAMSSAGVHNISSVVTCDPPEVPPGDSLNWFAEVVSSYKDDLEGKTNAAFDELTIPNGMDYFEFVTLNLIEVKVEECCYKDPVLDNQNDEETGAAASSRRPRRGQARRGRQRKDFQRDILPGLVSLSRHEVTEDILAFEELLKAGGHTLQSNLSVRSAAKNGRRRHQSGGSASSPVATSSSPLPEQQPLDRDTRLEEMTLPGWGRRTERMPRQRRPASNPARALKC